MNRTVKELREFLETLPDSEEISFWGDGFSFYHTSDGEFGNTPGDCIVTAPFCHSEYEDEAY